MSAESRDPTIEHIEYESAQNPEQAGFIGLCPSDVILRLKKTALDDLQNGHKSAEQVARSHEAGEKIGHPFTGRVGGAGL
jgi:hypothetical protein